MSLKNIKKSIRALENQSDLPKLRARNKELVEKVAKQAHAHAHENEEHNKERMRLLHIIQKFVNACIF